MMKSIHDGSLDNWEPQAMRNWNLFLVWFYLVDSVVLHKPILEGKEHKEEQKKFLLL